MSDSLTPLERAIIEEEDAFIEALFRGEDVDDLRMPHDVRIRAEYEASDPIEYLLREEYGHDSLDLDDDDGPLPTPEQH